MSFLVRKLVKRDKLYGIEEVEDINNISSDIPTTEFRTTSGTLSTWLIDSMEELEKAVLAIAVSSSDISRMDFIIIDTNLLHDYGLEYKNTYAGMDIPVPDLQDTHCDIIDLTIGKLLDCSKVYQKIFALDKEHEGVYIRRFTAGKIRDILHKAVVDGRIDKGKAKDKILIEIERIEDKIKVSA